MGVAIDACMASKGCTITGASADAKYSLAMLSSKLELKLYSFNVDKLEGGRGSTSLER